MLNLRRISSVAQPESVPRVKRPFVSLVVPGFNEADIVGRHLVQLCDYMQSLESRFDWELVFINDGSTDGTGDLADAFANTHPNVKVFHQPTNFRLGQALRCAFSKCSGDYVVVFDLDLSYAPEHIERMLDKLIETRAKIVIASPYMKGGRVSNVPWFRKVLSQCANRYLCLTATRDAFSDKLTTITGMVRAYDRQFLSKLHLKAMDVDINSEIIYKAKMLRARIVEIPAHLDWRPSQTAGQSEAATRKSSMRIVRNILQSLISGFLFRPFMFFGLPGICLILLSLYPIFWAFYHSIDHYLQLAATRSIQGIWLSEAIGAAFHQSPHAFIIGGFTLMIGIQLFCLGLMSLQKKRYFEDLFYLGSMMRQPRDVQHPHSSLSELLHPQNDTLAN